MSDSRFGPLAPLAGIWEGAKGADKAPDDDRVSVEHNAYRERLVLEPLQEVNNHEQTLFVLRYNTVVWRIGATEPFHEEMGYFMWDPDNKQVVKSFTVPRGCMVMAGGTAEPDARSFKMQAELGSQSYGICSNPWMAEEFKTEHYEIDIDIHDDNSFSYVEDTVLRIKGQSELFHHIDKNTLQRIE